MKIGARRLRRMSYATMSTVLASWALLATSTAAGTAIAAVPAASSTMSAPVPGGYESWADLYEVQTELDKTADQIVAISKGLGEESGYGSIVVSPETRTLTLYWKGSVPAQVKDVLDDIRADLSTTTVAAAYSLAEMQDAMVPLVENPEADGVKITHVGPKSDASGLNVSIQGDLDSAKQINSIAESAMPVTVELGAATEPYRDRKHDASPHWGGAKWSFKWNYAGCSTGFPLESKFTPSNTYLLTAAHCGADEESVGADVWIPDDGSAPDGEIAGSSPETDLALIRATSEPRIYSGGPESGTSYGVVGYSGTYVGDYICSGGHRSGEHCNIKITAVNVTQPGSEHPPNLSVGHQLDGKTAVVRGDSGGPVYSQLGSPYQNYVNAKGVIITGATDAGGAIECDEELPDDITECSEYVVFQPMTTVLETFPNLAVAEIDD
jgi:S1-C subfamily serine protease